MKPLQLSYVLLLSLSIAQLTGCGSPPKKKSPEKKYTPSKKVPVKAAPRRTVIPFNPMSLSNAAIERTRHKVKYDGKYVSLRYPMGDVPPNIGVCTDVIVRAYRRLGIDLQRNVHEDMTKRFALYPSKRIYGKSTPDSNIDHRRVVNLEKYFELHGQKLPLSQNGHDYKPGDLVTWRINGVAPHIGIVVNKRSKDGQRPLIVHNDGRGPVTEDILFKMKVLVGHYRYWPTRNRNR